ncbi:MAG: hypothetical protein AAGA62_05815, partial [Bacteroidota bacterium]
MPSKFTQPPCPILRTIDEEWILAGHNDLHDTTIVDVDLRPLTLKWENISVDDTTLFIGCQLPLETELALRKR